MELTCIKPYKSAIPEATAEPTVDAIDSIRDFSRTNFFNLPTKTPSLLKRQLYNFHRDILKKKYIPHRDLRYRNCLIFLYMMVTCIIL